MECFLVPRPDLSRRRRGVGVVQLCMWIRRKPQLSRQNNPTDSVGRRDLRTASACDLSSALDPQNKHGCAGQNNVVARPWRASPDLTRTGACSLCFWHARPLDQSSAGVS